MCLLLSKKHCLSYRGALYWHILPESFAASVELGILSLLLTLLCDRKISSTLSPPLPLGLLGIFEVEKKRELPPAELPRCS